jgi:5-methylcytosine-specific restriction endonuclease McrA
VITAEDYRKVCATLYAHDRERCWARDRGVRRACGCLLFWEPRFSGHPRAYDMAHIRSRGAGGSDVIDNVRALCHACHMREHSNGKRRTR